MAILEDISLQLQRGKKKNVVALCQQAVDEGLNADEILKDGLLAGMDIIGAKFKANEVFVPQVLVAARAMKAGSETLKPYLTEEGAESRGKAVIGTVKGDLHDIGKNLVAMMLEGKGFEVIDLGVDVEPQQFIDTAIENDSKIVICSALLTTTMPVMKEVVDAAVEAGVRDQINIMVGGAPVTKEFAESIGADIYTEDGATAAEVAVSLVA